MSFMLSYSMLPSEYIATYSKATTRRIRKSGILKYLRMHLGPGVHDVDEGMRAYLSSRDSGQITRDLTQFYTHPAIEALAPMTRASYLSSIECYFQDACEFQLPHLQRKLRERSKREKTAAVVQEIPPTREIWQAVLSHLALRHRAELLISLSGGLRIGEVLSLWVSDIFLDEVPCRIEIRGATTKNGLPRRTFISQEAVAALRAYLRVRDEQINRSLAKCQNCTVRYDMREVFPQHYRNENQFFWSAIDAAGFGQRDGRTGRRMLHVHSCRKWFITQAKKSSHPDFVESWVGHAGYLSSSYHRPSLEEEREEYLRCELDVTINLPADYYKVKFSYESELQRMRDLQDADREAIALLRQELAELKARAVVPREPSVPGVIPDFE